METTRKIIHLDMDAFYASVEQRDRPELRGKPLAVGGDSDRGVVATASYEARKFGVRSAMPTRTALRLCPHLIIVKPRIPHYRVSSEKFREIMEEYTDLVEPLSLDEAFLDVTHNKKNIPSATLIAQEIRERVKSELQLTCSAGISTNKFLAKVASDMNKPDGLTLIGPEVVEEFIEKLPIQKFFGIGKVTASRLVKMGILTGADLKARTETDLNRIFGKRGHFFYQLVRGTDNREVNPDHVIKSVSVESTYGEDIHSEDGVMKALQDLCVSLEKRLVKKDVKGRTITMKVKYADFRQITRSRSLNTWVNSYDEIYLVTTELASQVDARQGIRLLGVGLSNLNIENEESGQLTLRF